MSTPHGVIKRLHDRIVCVCGAVLYAVGRQAQYRAFWDHSDKERGR